jgi:hypothetical protein
MFTIEQLHSVFETLEAQGIFAPRQPWQCCSGCGIAAVPEGSPYVFYHEQDTENCYRFRQMYLAFGGNDATATATVGQTVVDALLSAGAVVEWDGSESTRIVVEVDDMDNPYQDEEEEVDVYEDPWADEGSGDL